MKIYIIYEKYKISYVIIYNVFCWNIFYLNKLLSYLNKIYNTKLIKNIFIYLIDLYIRLVI